MTKQEMKKELVTYSRLLAESGMVTLYEGNLSIRTENGCIITPTTTNKLTITEEQMVEIDNEGNVLNPECGKKASSEYRLHLEAYRLRPDAQACIHFHSNYATAYAVAGKPIEPKGDTTAIIIFGEIPLCKYGRPRTDDIAADLKNHLLDHDAVLLGNHGAMVIAQNLEAAYANAQIVEKTAQLEYLVEALGGEDAFPESEYNALRNM